MTVTRMLAALIVAWFAFDGESGVPTAGSAEPATNSSGGFWSYCDGLYMRSRREVEDLRSFATAASPSPAPASERSWIEWTCNTVIGVTLNWIGWAILGASWHGIRTQAARLLGITSLLAALCDLSRLAGPPSRSWVGS